MFFNTQYGKAIKSLRYIEQIIIQLVDLTYEISALKTPIEYLKQNVYFGPFQNLWEMSA